MTRCSHGVKFEERCLCCVLEALTLEQKRTSIQAPTPSAQATTTLAGAINGLDKGANVARAIQKTLSNSNWR